MENGFGGGRGATSPRKRRPSRRHFGRSRQEKGDFSFKILKESDSKEKG